MHDPARTIPVLPSLDIGESHRFYVGILGFGEVYRDDGYLIIRRDQMEMHFRYSGDRKLPESTPCYIRGGQIEALYREFSRSRVPRLSDFSIRPWNMKEFYIHDPHGKFLRFGMAPEEASPDPQ